MQQHGVMIGGYWHPTHYSGGTPRPVGQGCEPCFTCSRHIAAGEIVEHTSYGDTICRDCTQIRYISRGDPFAPVPHAGHFTDEMSATDGEAYGTPYGA